MKRRDFNEALRQAEHARADRTLPPDAERRIRALADGGARTRPWAWTFALGGAVALALVALMTWTAARTDAPLVPREVNGFALLQGEGAVQVQKDGSLQVRGGAAEVVDSQARITASLSDGAVLRREQDGLRVVTGQATFSVDKRKAGEAPARVLVSGGSIEVLGTRFTIIQRAASGEVALHEGRIRFVAPDGQTVTLLPGQSLSWPLPEQVTARPVPVPAPVQGPVAAAPPQPQHAAPSVKKPSPVPVPPPFDVEGFIEELSTLRRRGQFALAATQLEGALQKPLPSETRERLSYELGSILTWQLKDAPRACAVWAQHGQAWPDGRYAAEVTRARAALHCE